MTQGTILVIGSNSFSGISFCASAVASGHRVIGVSRSVFPDNVFVPNVLLENWEKFQFVQLDINRDLDQLEALWRKEAVNAVVNFASQSMVAQSWSAPLDWYRTNVLGTIALTERLKSLETLQRYIHISTPEVYGSISGFHAESDLYRPSTPYAASRACADMHLALMHREFGFPVVFTRAANVYGPGQALYRLIPKAILSFVAKRKFSLDGGGLSRRSFIHIDDVSSATLLLLDKGELGRTYHIATEELVSIREVVERLAVKTNVNAGLLIELADERVGKDATYSLSSNSLRSLGWSDQIGLDRGLDSVVSWCDSNIEELLTLPTFYSHKA